MDNDKPKDEDLDLAPIITVSGIMNKLEGEIEAIASGDIDTARGRLIVQGRRAQLQAVSLNLAAARLSTKVKDRMLPKWMGMVEKPKQA